MAKRTYMREISLTIENYHTNESVVIEGVRISYTIKKTNKESGNSAKIQVFNLSATTRGTANSTEKEDGDPQSSILLYAGYRDQSKSLLFKGLAKIHSVFEAPNWVTRIEAVDIAKTLRETIAEKVYTRGTPIKTIVSDLVTNSGMSIQRIGDITGTLPTTRAFTGSPLQTIEKLQSKYGFIFDVQDGDAVVKPPENESNPQYLTVLNKTTGLIGTPRIKGGLVVMDSLVIPQLRPNSYVRLVSDNADVGGVFPIVKVTARGDNWGSNSVMQTHAKFIEGTTYYSLDGITSSGVSLV